MVSFFEMMMTRPPSPEILQNQPYTEKADIWALGCMMYELIMLKPAFSGNNPLQMAKKIVTREYERIP